MTAGTAAAYVAALAAAFFGGFVWGRAVSFIHKLGTSA